MEYKQFNTDNTIFDSFEQAYASANHVLTEEQKRKLIQNKFKRAKAMYEFQKRNPIGLEDL